MAASPTSLNGLLYSLGLALDDAARGTTDAPGASTALQFISSDLAAGQDDEFKGSEVWFEDTTGMTGRNPFRITANVASSGLVTLKTAYGATAPAAGLNFVVQNIGQDGYPHQKKLEAVLMALRDAGVWLPIGPYTLTVNTTDYIHALPDELDVLGRVEFVDGSGYTTIIPLSTYTEGINAEEHTVYLPLALDGDVSLRAWGWSLWTDPAQVTSADFAAVIPNIRPPDIVLRALAWIRQGKLGRAEQASGANLMQLVDRRLRQTPPPGAIVLRRYG